MPTPLRVRASAVVMRLGTGVLGLAAFMVGCPSSGASGPAAASATLEAAPSVPDQVAAAAVVPPDGYEGPIDPEWPPSHAADLDLELRASAILRDRSRAGGAVEPASGEPLLEGDHPGVFVEASHIADFDYLEVILGEVPDVDAELPLIVLLHGRGDKPRIPAGGALAQDAPVRIFIPRAPDRLGDGYTWLATWTRSGETELLARSLAGRADQLAPAIEAFRRLRPTKYRPVLVGFSQGAIMSYAMAVRYPRRFAAAIPIAGWLPEAMLPGALPELPEGVRLPYIHAIHGTSDTVVPFENGEATVRGLRAIGWDVQWTPVPGAAHTVTPEMGKMVRSWLRGGLFPDRFPDELPPGLFPGSARASGNGG